MAGWGAAIGGIAQGVEGLLNRGHSWFQNKKDREHSEKMLKKQFLYDQFLAMQAYGFDQQQLEYMNEYNTPANQKQRLLDAGLNPGLMYGSAPQNTQTDMVRYNKPDAPDFSKIPSPKIPAPLSPTQALGEYYDIRMKEKQLDYMDQQIESNFQGANYTATKNFYADQKGMRDFGISHEKDASGKWIIGPHQEHDFYLDKLKDEQSKRSAEAQRREKEAMLIKNNIFPNDPIWYRLLMSNVTEKEVQDYVTRLTELAKKHNKPKPEKKVPEYLLQYNLP